MKSDTPKFVILYAEDDEDDLQMVQDCFTQYSHLVEIVHAESGAKALKALNRLGAKGITPCLIILDINMPIMDGRETLMHLKKSDGCKEIPVVLFTTSNSNLDKSFAQKWGAELITKPLQYGQIENLAQQFIRRCREEAQKRA